MRSGCPVAGRKPSGADSLQLEHSHQAPTSGLGQGKRGRGRDRARLRRGLRGAMNIMKITVLEKCVKVNV